MQPLACDEELSAHVLRAVTSTSAYGASKDRRAVFRAARDIFPNLLIVIRDPAHAIRIASNPLHCDDVLGKVWQEVLDARHALVPELMNSSKWHNLLVAIQERKHPGCGDASSAAYYGAGHAERSVRQSTFDSTASLVG